MLKNVGKERAKCLRIRAIDLRKCERICDSNRVRGNEFVRRRPLGKKTMRDYVIITMTASKIGAKCA